MTTTVDIAIPCYRYGNFLRQCVESVLSQENVSVRVLIIDDASPDNSAEVGAELARQYKNVEFRRHKANKGHIATYNEGIEWASADLFLLLSADDYLLPGALGAAADLMATTPSISFVFSDALMLFDDGTTQSCGPFPQIPATRTSVLSSFEFIRAMKGRNIVPTATAIVRTRAQKRVGGYSKELPHAGDMAMWLRLAAEGDVGFVNSHQAIYRMHAQNMSRSYIPSRLPDVVQRLAAIENFLDYAVSLDRDLLRRMLLREVGKDAIKLASAAFNDGSESTSHQLALIAADCYPGVRYTSLWLRYRIKCIMGQRAWRALRSTYKRAERVKS